MVDRNQRTGAKPAPAKMETKPAWPPETHSGEGSASALATLQTMETRRRLATRPGDVQPPMEESRKGS